MMKTFKQGFRLAPRFSISASVIIDADEVQIASRTFKLNRLHYPIIDS